jgi:hypothetical protein
VDQSIQPANEAETNVFLKAAEQRFAELGVDPEFAARAFSTYLAKQAEVLGVQTPAAEYHTEKQASDEEEAQLAVFFKSAVDRFVELGIPEADAIAYLDAKAAESRPSEKVVKIAEHLKTVINQ